MPDRTAEKPAAASSPAPAVKAQPFHYARPNGEAPNISARPNGGESGATHSSSSDPIAEKAYQKGLVDGKSAARGEFEKALAELRGQITEAVHHFSKDRADYFTRVETEVVRLSLSIARKILHRESQLDPFVLTGVVHVALQKLNSETKITIRAHHDEVRIWKDYFRQSEDIFPAVTVTADPSLSLGHVLLETEFGTTEISLDTQLKEIEQGFFDLLEQRPKALP
jgi:flagellar assembly protein FliH